MLSQERIPFHRTLRFKLFASYCALLLLTVFATLFVHTHGVGRFLDSRFREDLKVFAVESRSELERLLQRDGTQGVEHFLYLSQESSPYRFRYVSFKDAEQDEALSFHLSEKEEERLTRGEVLEGSASGRVEILPHRKWRSRFRKRRRGGPLKLEPSRFVAVGIRDHQERVVGALVLFDIRPGASFRLTRLANSLRRSLTFVVLLAVLATFLLSQHLTKPLRRMEEVVQDFSRGHLSSRTGLERSDELGVLARGFDHMASEIESYAATRTRLLNDVSHELGTPVTTIRATLEALLDDMVEPEQQREFLESSLHQLEHLSRIVNDVTELARFETGRISVHKMSVEAAFPVQRAVEAARAIADRNSIALHLDLREAEGVVFGDPDRLAQVVKNLLMNAIHHNPEGTTVTVSCQGESEWVSYSVCDDGPGIPESDVEKIFERFYKVSESRTRDESTSGLGLAIVRRILQQHDTDIEFSQFAGEKRFSFSIQRPGSSSDSQASE